VSNQSWGGKETNPEGFSYSGVDETSIKAGYGAVEDTI